MGANFVLVANERSGSFNADTVQAILDHADALGLGKPRAHLLPDHSCPSPDALEDADIVAVFGGDGTVNSVVSCLDGWGGAVLILPGGTMNLASKRLHGDRPWRAIMDDVQRGAATRERHKVLSTSQGMALAGVMLGPGTAWNDVREAMREVDLAAMAASTVSAFSTTADGPRVYCAQPRIGREEGYPMLEVRCDGESMRLDCFHADDAGEFLVGLSALALRDFRAGPHDTFHTTDEVTFESSDGSPVALLLDGEPAEESPSITVSMAECGVDLLATAVDD